KHEPAPCKLGKKRRELGAGLPQQASTKDHGREIGLDHEMAADPLHHDCALDRTAAEPARLLGRADAEPAELGKAPPDVAAEAELACDEPAALVEGVFLLEKARDALRQQSLLLAQRKIHVPPTLPSPSRGEGMYRRSPSPSKGARAAKRIEGEG